MEIGASPDEAGRALQMAPDVGLKFQDCQNYDLNDAKQVDIILNQRVMIRRFISYKKRLN